MLVSLNIFTYPLRPIVEIDELLSIRLMDTNRALHPTRASLTLRYFYRLMNPVLKSFEGKKLENIHDAGNLDIEEDE